MTSAKALLGAWICNIPPPPIVAPKWDEIGESFSIGECTGAPPPIVPQTANGHCLCCWIMLVKPSECFMVVSPTQPENMPWFEYIRISLCKEIIFMKTVMALGFLGQFPALIRILDTLPISTEIDQQFWKWIWNKQAVSLKGVEYMCLPTWGKSATDCRIFLCATQDVAYSTEGSSSQVYFTYVGAKGIVTLPPPVRGAVCHPSVRGDASWGE